LQSAEAVNSQRITESRLFDPRRCKIKRLERCQFAAYLDHDLNARLARLRKLIKWCPVARATHRLVRPIL
jgi:hypothetical protein